MDNFILKKKNKQKIKYIKLYIIHNNTNLVPVGNKFKKKSKVGWRSSRRLPQIHL